MKREYEHPTITEIIPQVVNLLSASSEDKSEVDIFID